MRKNIFAIMILFSILLAWCWLSNQTDTKRWMQTKQVNTQKSNEISEKMEQKDEWMKKIYMQELPKDEQKIFTDLEEAQKSWDTKKEEELLKQIQSERETKLKTLDEAVSKKDDKTAIQIRRELRMYDITLRSAKSIITTTK